MTVRSWARNLFARPVTRSIRQAAARCRPHLEVLEDRLAPAADQVTSLSDDGSAGTLRDAITQANANPGPDTIDFQVTGTIALAGGLLPAFTDSATTTVTGPSGGITLDAHRASGIFQVNRGAAVGLTGLTLANGSAGGGGRIFNYGTLALTSCTLSGNDVGYFGGGGINNRGTLTLTNSTLSGNTAGFGGGGVANYGTLTVTNSTFSGNTTIFGGGGIMNRSGTVTLTNSTLSGNTSEFSGGGVANYAGPLTLTNSTLSGNTANFAGGGVYNSGTLTLTNVTLFGNAAGGVARRGGVYSGYGGGVFNRYGTSSLTNVTLSGNGAGAGGGVFNAGTLSLYNSIVANSTQGGDLSGGVSGGHNLFGVVALGPLADNGGPTQTMALPAGSPALEAADPALAPVPDQRGSVRKSQPDIGAYEAVICVTTLADEDNGSIYPSLGTGTSLREAINFANAHPGLVNITFAVSGTLSLDGTPLPTITNDLTIIASTAGLTIDARGASGIFQVNTGATVSLAGLTLANGSATDGGAILNDGTLALISCTLSGNAASDDGGAIENLGTLTLTNTTLYGNSAGDSGGGVANAGTSSLTNVTLSGNGAGAGGGVFNAGTLSLNNSIVANSTQGGDLSGGVSGGHNLFGVVALGPLADNGGPTQTMALPAGSPALGAADPALAPATDQRGFQRKATPDIGSFDTDNVIVVTTALDGAGRPVGSLMSLREAINVANSAPVAVTITFAVSGSLSLDGTQLPAITGDLTIVGPTAGLTIDAHGASGIFQVNAGATVSLAGLTLANGSATDGGAILNDGTLALSTSTLSGNAASHDGGGVYNAGTLTLTNDTLSGNRAYYGGGLANYGVMSLTNCTFAGNAARFGAGIVNHGTLTVTDSTLDGNVATQAGAKIPDFSGSGGGIYNAGTLTVTDSTLAGNTAQGAGAAILNTGTTALTDSTLSGNAAQFGGGVYNAGTLTLTNSTLSGNTAEFGGGGIANTGQMAVKNCTISGNSALNPFSYSPYFSYPGGGGIFETKPGGRLSLNNSIVANNFGGDIGGPAVFSYAITGGHNLFGTVGLGPLADNGGPTRTMALPAGSPALGAADPSLAPAADQRGAPRGAHPDIGAFQVVRSVVVTTLADEDNGSIDPSLGTGTSLREAIAFADHNPGGAAITFAVSGTISQDGTPLPAITGDLTIVGPTAGLTIDAHGASAIFQIDAGASVTLSGLSLTHGSATDGGAILNAGTLTLISCTLSGNRAYDGGGVYNAGTLTLSTSTLTGNAASHDGGAIDNVGTLGVTNSTLSGNSAGSGGGVYNAGTLTLTNATLAGNAAGAGGGIFSRYVNPSQPGVTTLDNSIVGGNTLSGGTTPSDLAGDSSVAAASSHNLIGPGGSGGLANGVNGNIVVTSVAALKLGPLADNGGPTQTIGLLPGSPAIDAGDNSLAGVPESNPVSVLSDPGFETPSLGAGSFAYDPTGSAWTFAGGAGLASNGSGFDNPLAPQGTQVAFLQGSDSSISQAVDLAAGTYVIAFNAAQRPGNQQTFEVLVDGAVVATVTPSGSGFAPYATHPFTVTAGSHTITFVGLNPQGGDNTAFLDNSAVLEQVLSPLATDQRGPGFARIIGPAVDIGAFEGQVQEQPSTVTSTLTAVTGDEGSPATNSGTFADPQGNGTVTLTASLGAITQDNATGTWSWSYTPADGPSGPTPVTITATDDGGLMASTTFTLTVNNVAPAASITSLPASGHSPEGAAISLGSTVTDPSQVDTAVGFSYAWSVTKNGAAYASGSDAAFGFTPDDNGTYVVTLTATDKDGGVSAPATATTTVDNVAPTAAITRAPASGHSPEGTAITLGSSVTDPGSADTAAGFTYAWSVTKNGAAFSSGTAASFSFTPDDNGTYAVTLTATDKDGAASQQAGATIVVDNVAPTAGVSGPADGVRGQARTFILTASDPSSADQAAGFTFAITWGDGATQTVSGPSGATASHVYTASGTYAVKVTATDKDGGAGAAATVTDTITAVALEADPTDPSKTALFVGGTTAADTITIKPADASGTLNVTIGKTDLGNFKPTGHLVVYGQAGDDTIKLQTASIKGSGKVSVSAPAFLFGDDGNDTISTAGSSANNVLEGGAGNDTLQAASGRDLLVGGLGADVLHGDGGDDLLVGGTTDYENNLAALDAVMAEWGRTDADYNTRVKHLNGTLGGGSNGVTLLTAGTVHDDAASDTLFGEGGSDWFFALLSGSNQDKVKDSASGEVVTGL